MNTETTTTRHTRPRAERIDQLIRNMKAILILRRAARAPYAHLLPRLRKLEACWKESQHGISWL